MNSTGRGAAVQPSRRRDSGVLSLVRNVKPHKYPKTSTTVLLWLFGLYVVFFAKPPREPSPQDIEAFEQNIKEVEKLDGSLESAYQVYSRLEAEQYQHKVWFWRWRAAYRAEVAAMQPAVDAAKAEVDAIRGQQEQLFSAAKARLGLWSEAGVGESKELFWQSFQGGKVFAQRQSFWDAVFSIMGSRDRDWLGLLLQLIITTVINFTTGLTVSVFVFLGRLPGLLLSYQPTWWSALLFFLTCAVGAISVVASYLGLLYAAGAVAVYSTVSLVDASRRLEGAQRRRIAAANPHED